MSPEEAVEAVRRGRDARLTEYLALIEAHPDWFGGPVDGVTIVVEPSGIAEIEETMAVRYAGKGWPAEWAQIGLGYEDPYLLVLRDAVRFLDGGPGVHHRVVRRAGNAAGVAMLPIHDGQIALLRHYRHPMRAWSWEIPRGAVEPGDSPEEMVRIELLEEIEAVVESLTPLGRVFGSTGFMGLSVETYLARIGGFGKPALDEGIGEVILVSVERFEAMVRDGEIVDSFTLAAFLHARLRGLI